MGALGWQRIYTQPQRPNNSFKPNLLRYTNNVAGKACHVVGYATQVGLTQALGRNGNSCSSSCYSNSRGSVSPLGVLAVVLEAARNPSQPHFRGLGRIRFGAVRKLPCGLDCRRTRHRVHALRRARLRRHHVFCGYFTTCLLDCGCGSRNSWLVLPFWGAFRRVQSACTKASCALTIRSSRTCFVPLKLWQKKLAIALAPLRKSA